MSKEEEDYFSFIFLIIAAKTCFKRLIDR